ncbi:MAG: hypothetical protein MJZ33_14215, partial [Paludibacteraceae bacterium]|nr:hypothetical protein [Paludibacteraceae bacterium]
AKLDNFTEQDPLFNNSVAAKITKEDTNNWNAKLSEEKDPIYTKSPAASIKEQNIQQWNAKVDSTTYMNSAAAKITQNDVANWNAKLDASKLPANVSAFNNDAEYVKKQILNDSIKAISNRLGSTISTLQENNKQLSAKIKKLEEDYSELFETVNKIGNLTDKIAQSALAYRRAETTSYPLKFNNWNNTPDAYNALQDGDRIIFIIRHSIRSEESAFDSKLTKEGINLAKEVGAKLRGGKATANDAYYGSTNYPRCMQTSFYIAQSRGDSNWKDSSMVVNPISEILQTYYSSSTDWDYFAKLYEQSPEVTNDLSVKMINRLCQLSEGKTFAWFTTHDFVAVPLCSWASYGAINFKRPNWINFLTGVAVIVHPDNSWEVYPVKCNDSPYSSVSWYK